MPKPDAIYSPPTPSRREATSSPMFLVHRVSELPKLFDLSKVGTAGVVFDENLLQDIHFKLIRKVCLSAGPLLCALHSERVIHTAGQGAIS